MKNGRHSVQSSLLLCHVYPFSLILLSEVDVVVGEYPFVLESEIIPCLLLNKRNNKTYRGKKEKKIPDFISHI